MQEERQKGAWRNFWSWSLCTVIKKSDVQTYSQSCSKIKAPLESIWALDLASIGFES